jgi:hypothetical protein
MPSAQSDYLAARLQAVKDLYAEMFILMDRSVQEDPLKENIGGLDRLIRPRMAQLEQTMKVFRREVEDARAAAALPAPLAAAIGEFEEQLRSCLQIMSGRVNKRIAELSLCHAALKEQMNLVKHKKRGAAGYRNKAGGGKLLDSNV